jgi:hypothetical protein
MVFLLYDRDKYENRRNRERGCRIDSVKVQAEIIEHDILLVSSAFNHGTNSTGKTFRQFLVLVTFPVATTAVPDDQVDIVGRYISAPHIAVVVILSVKRANFLMYHGFLVCKNRRVQSLAGKSERKFVTNPRLRPMDYGVTT